MRAPRRQQPTARSGGDASRGAGGWARLHGSSCGRRSARAGGASGSPPSLSGRLPARGAPCPLPGSSAMGSPLWLLLAWLGCSAAAAAGGSGARPLSPPQASFLAREGGREREGGLVGAGQAEDQTSDPAKQAETQAWEEAPPVAASSRGRPGALPPSWENAFELCERTFRRAYLTGLLSGPSGGEGDGLISFGSLQARKAGCP